MGGERHGPDFQNVHRNKRGLTLNLKKPEGLGAFRRMVAKADVVVENYRPDVKDRLGIGYDAVAAVNPRVILGSISGFGQDGPYARRPGFDQIAQGMAGLMGVTGLPGQGPVRRCAPGYRWRTCRPASSAPSASWSRWSSGNRRAGAAGSTPPCWNPWWP